MTTEVHHFHSKNSAEFHVWCAIVHWQGFTPVYMTRANILVLGWVRALQSFKHIDVSCLHRESDVTQVKWIKIITLQWSCTQYSMSMHLQQLPKAHAHITRSRALMTREGCSHIHHTKCTITHIQAYIYTHIHHAQCYHTELESKADTTIIPRVWSSKVQKM